MQVEELKKLLVQERLEIERLKPIEAKLKELPDELELAIWTAFASLFLSLYIEFYFKLMCTHIFYIGYLTWIYFMR